MERKPHATSRLSYLVPAAYPQRQQYNWVAVASGVFSTPIKRRDFLKTPVAVGIGLSPLSVLAEAVSDVRVEENLRFDISPDRRQVTVILQRVIYEKAGDEEKVTRTEAEWILNNSSFGSSAKFSLYPSGADDVTKTDEVDLLISKASYGRNAPGKLIFKFTRISDKETKNTVWNIRAVTNIWSDSENTGSKPGAFITLGGNSTTLFDFIGTAQLSGLKLEGESDAVGVGNTLSKTFNGLVNL